MVAAALFAAGFAVSMPDALAKFISVANPSNTITGHTLVKPALSCSATGIGLLGSHIHLSWGATSDSTTADPYGGTGNYLTDGYEIYSGIINGSTYTLLATVARTATTYDDNAPVPGTSYYVIRSTKQQLWRSANSIQVTASVGVLSASCS